MIKKKRPSQYTVFIDEGEKTATRIAALLRRFGYDDDVAVRHSKAWGCAVGYVDYEWIASLVHGCCRAAPKEPEAELDMALEAITKTFDGNDVAVDSLWRLGGQEAVVKVVEAGPYCHIYLGLGYTWSFDDRHPSLGAATGSISIDWSTSSHKIFRI